MMAGGRRAQFGTTSHPLGSSSTPEWSRRTASWSTAGSASWPPAEVHRELRLARRNHTRGVTEGVQAFERGAWSRPEGVLGELLDASDVLPHVCLNPRLRLPDGTALPTPDGYVREVALAIQVHSRAHHARDDDWEGTVEGDATLTRAGILVRGVTPRTLYVSGDRFLEDVERTYQTLLGRPLPELSIRSRCC
jgi:hypothetical protein